MPVLDAVGQEIHIGDIIVYTNKSGSSTYTTVSVVKKINSKTGTRWTWSAEKGNYREEFTAYSLRVRGTARYRPARQISDADSTVTCVDRVTKVRFYDMSAELQNLFRPHVAAAIGALNA